MPLNKGTVLNNRYRIVSLLGQGGFGAVYRAWDMEMKAPCAVKENLDLLAESQRQFEREASMLFKLRHSNLPKVYGSFTLPGAGQYLVMDFIEGQDLQQMLDQQGGPLPLENVLGWIGEVCDALTYMHSRQPPIIHRDIKPANIKITPDGEAVLVDFGIAKEFDPGQKTFTGARAYTPGYASPEQQGGKGTDALSDIYALGATTYALLTGLVPPSATDIISEITPPPEPVDRVNPDVPEHVSRVIEAAMQIPRSQRISSVGAFKAVLYAGEASPPVSPPPPPPVKKTVQAGGVPPGGSAPQASAASFRNFPNWLPWAGGLLLLVVVVIIAYTIGKNITGGGSAADTTDSAGLQATRTALAVAALLTDTQSPSPMPTETPAPPSPTYTATTVNTTAPASLPVSLTSGGVLMALVPAGAFMMGGDADDALAECERYRSDCKRSWIEDEEPPHEVYLDDYYIDVYEVTNAQFAEFLNDMGNQEESEVTWLDAGDEDVLIQSSGGVWEADSGYEDHPVIEVSWYGARAYCEWRGARLPTEAEWEKVAGWDDTADVKYVYPWGNEFDCQKGNFDDETVEDDYVIPGGAGCDGYDRTAPVGSFPAGRSPYRLYDMAGNVWEWVADWYDADYYQNPPYENPLGPSSGESRVTRGGSWSYIVVNIRTAIRGRYGPDGTDSDLGFRCARSP
jgi:serine/threonine-protein kinase